MYARVSTYEGRAEDFDRGLEKVKSDIVPRVRELPGNAGILLMVERATGRSMSVVLYDSEEALEASREAAGGVRSQAAEGIGATVTSVTEYEVGVADLS